MAATDTDTHDDPFCYPRGHDTAEYQFTVCGAEFLIKRALYEEEYGPRRRNGEPALRRDNVPFESHSTQVAPEEVGADGVEISAHWLCAEDHVDYQGKQYPTEKGEAELNDGTKKLLVQLNIRDTFEDIQAKLKRKLGTWNCKHFWYPIMIGITPPAYSTEQLGQMKKYSNVDKVTVNVNGQKKTMSRYKWSQEMRKLETNVREQKDIATFAEITGDDALYKQSQDRIKTLQQTYSEIAKQSGNATDYTRMNVYGYKGTTFGGKGVEFKDIPARFETNELNSDKNNDIMSSEKTRLLSYYPNTVNTRVLHMDGFKEMFEQVSDIQDVQESLYKCTVEMLENRQNTNGEDLYLINAETGTLEHSILNSTKDKQVVYSEEDEAKIKEIVGKGTKLISLHNHPNGLPPTLDDGASARGRGYSSGVVVGHNLEIYTFTPTNRDYKTEDCDIIYDEFIEKNFGVIDFEDKWYTDYLEKHGMSARRITK